MKKQKKQPNVQHLTLYNKKIKNESSKPNPDFEKIENLKDQYQICTTNNLEEGQEEEYFEHFTNGERPSLYFSPP